MKPNPIHRLPAPLEAAIQRLKMAARQAAERTVESLGLAAIVVHERLYPPAKLVAARGLLDALYLSLIHI